MNERQTGEITIKPYAIQWGLIGGFASVILSLILYFTKLQYENWAKYLPTVITVAAIIYGIKVIADNNPGIVPLGKLFKGGFLIAFIIAILNIAYIILYQNVIEPDFVEKSMDIVRTQLEEKGMSEEQIDVTLSYSRKFMSPVLMPIFAMISSLMFGALAAIIGAAIFKREK